MSSASSSRRPSATGVPQTKVRASALRDYYGLAASEDPTTPTASSSNAAGPPTSSDPLDTDSSAFDASKALKQLAQTASLAQLMNRESELLVEIRELDGERQSLVYNHHHELVAASETIRKMKTRADDLTPSLDQLRTSLARIATLRQDVRIPSHLNVSQQPDEVSKAIRQIAELPTTLKDCVALADDPAVGTAEAERLWGRMESVLAAWDEAGAVGVKDIRSECRAVLPRPGQHAAR